MKRLVHLRLKVPALLVIPVVIYGVGFALMFLWNLATHSTPFTQVPLPAFSVLGTPPPPTAEPPSFIGQPAPDFSLTGLDGKPHQLQDYRGKRLILNFWATWCAPCRLEMPLLQKTYAHYQSTGLVILGIDQAEDAATVSNYVKELNLTIPMVLDRDLSATQAYGVIGLPTTFFIDEQGIVQARNVGMLTEDSLQKYLEDFGVAERKEPTSGR